MVRMKMRRAAERSRPAYGNPADPPRTVTLPRAADCFLHIEIPERRTSSSLRSAHTGGRMNRALGTVVVGVAQVEQPDPLLQAAVGLIGDRATGIIAVHAYRLPDPFIASYPDMVTLDPELATAAEQALLRQLEEQINSLGVARVQARVLPGPPDIAILSVADETGADLILVGGTE